MRGKTVIRNELLDNDHVFVPREHGEMPQWCHGVEYTPDHSRVAQCGVVCGRLLSPQISQQNRSRIHLTHRRRRRCATDVAFTEEQSYGTRAQERRPQGHSRDFKEHKTSRVWLERKEQWGGWTCLMDQMEKLCLCLSQSHVSCHAKWLRPFLVTYADLAKFCRFFGFCLLIYRMR